MKVCGIECTPGEVFLAGVLYGMEYMSLLDSGHTEHDTQLIIQTDAHEKRLLDAAACESARSVAV